MSELSGKVILMTGASRGIGKAAFEQAIVAGGKVILHYGSSHDAAARLADAAGPERCLAIAADFARPEDVERLWDEALAWKGRIDVLVNNAAIYEPAPISMAASKTGTPPGRALCKSICRRRPISAAPPSAITAPVAAGLSSM